MLEELYKAREVEPFYFDSKLEQKTAFLVLNSSLYHVYWMTYGNQHHHNWTQLSAFPWPDESRIADREAEIRSIADALWGADERFLHRIKFPDEFTSAGYR